MIAAARYKADGATPHPLHFEAVAGYTFAGLDGVVGLLVGPRLRLAWTEDWGRQLALQAAAGIRLRIDDRKWLDFTTAFGPSVLWKRYGPAATGKAWEALRVQYVFPFSQRVGGALMASVIYSGHSSTVDGVRRWGAFEGGYLLGFGLVADL